MSFWDDPAFINAQLEGIGAPPVAPPPGPPAPAVNPATQTGDGSANALALAHGLFGDFIDQLGLKVEDFAQWAREGINLQDSLSVTAKIREQPGWKARFPAIIDPKTKQLRYNEGQYIQIERDLRKTLADYGKTGYDNPQDLAAFFEQNIKPDELGTRLKTYTDIERGGQFVKNAFYVYGGVKVSTDDLYQAAVDPAAYQRLVSSYNQAVATSSPDYVTWITRATEAGLATVADTVQQLENSGALPSGSAAKALSQLNPDQARLVMDSLYHGGQQTGPFLNLDELTHAFQYAMIGSAATGQGLQLTDQSTVEQLRQAGVDRAKALEGYGKIATQQNLLNSELERSGQHSFTQQDFEKAVFLQTGTETQALAKAAGYEKSLGEAGGGPSFQTTGDRLQQRGLATRSF